MKANIIYLHAKVWCLVVVIVSIGVHGKKSDRRYLWFLSEMAKIWEILVALYGAKCRVPTDFI